MTECQYCKKEYPKGIKMHEKYCKSIPIVAQDAPGQEIIDIPCKDMPEIETPSISASEQKETINTPAPKLSWMNRLLHQTPKHAAEKKQATIDEMLLKLPRWSIKQREPMFAPKNKNSSWIQIVAFSRTRPPMFFWAEYDGVSVSVGDMFFPAPHDIRGKVFPYDMDKGIPLLDNSKDFNDMSYWNKLVERVKNMYFTLGLVTGAGDFTKNIGLILLIVAIVGLIGIGNLYMSWQIANGLAVSNSQIGNLTYQLQNYMYTHP